MIKHIEVEEICIKQVVNNPIYINGFFLYYFPCQEVVGAEKEIFEDVKTFIDQGFMILTGEDWGQEVIIFVLLNLTHRLSPVLPDVVKSNARSFDISVFFQFGIS